MTATAWPSPPEQADARRLGSNTGAEGYDETPQADSALGGASIHGAAPRAAGNVAKGGRRRRSRVSSAEDIVHTSEWKEGLRFGLRTLNTKTVKRARAADSVLIEVLRHNLRIDNEKHRHRSGQIDSHRSRLNTMLRGAAHPSEANDSALAIFKRLGIDLAACRHDVIVAMEMVFQPPSGWDQPIFYDTALEWVNARYEHVVSAVIHRDQERPHMHVVALALLGGRLKGAEMTSGMNRFRAQLTSFAKFMRDQLGLRHDRQTKSSTAILTSPGKGPRTRIAAERSDRELMQRMHAREATSLPTDLLAHAAQQAQRLPTSLPSTSYCAALARASATFAQGVAAGHFRATRTQAVTSPAPRPRDASAGEVAPPPPPPPIVAAGSIGPPARAATPTAVPAHASRGATIARRPWVLPPSMQPTTVAPETIED